MTTMLRCGWCDGDVEELEAMNNRGMHADCLDASVEADSESGCECADCFRIFARSTLTGQRWWGLTDEESEGTVVASDGQLAYVVLHYDNRDAITGSRLLYAPPAQQYGFRLQWWAAWGQMVAEAAAAPCPDCGVAPNADCECPF